MEHVTREEFERLCSYADKLMEAVKEQNRIVDEHLKTTLNLIARLEAAERFIAAQQPPASAEGVEVQQSIEEMVAAEMIRMGAKPVELKP
jgi:hypothetical protein